MKIEPAVYVRKKAIDFLNGASKTAYVEAKLCRTKTNDFELTYPLYTESQLRQLGEACAQVAGPEDSYQDEWFNAKADAVNKINARIKELLP